MNVDSETGTLFRTLHLDDTLLELNPEEEAFFKSTTGIQGTEELKKHIVGVQEDGRKVHPYPCICGFGFVRLKIARMPVYLRALELGKNRPEAIFLDIGCCLGTDVRKVIHDGWPMSRVIATDLEVEFWDLGHKLFRTAPETYPVKFLAGDAFDDTHLSPTVPAPPGPPPPLTSVNTLTELQKQFELGKRLAALLDPRHGSIIFGSHGCMPVKGQSPDTFPDMFCHSPGSWTQMWEEQIFGKGQVRVNAVVKESKIVVERRQMAVPLGKGIKFPWLVWSVERL